MNPGPPMDPWIPMDPDESAPAIDVARLPAIVDPAPVIDVDAILALHRGSDGHIPFMRKPDPGAPPRLDKDGRPHTFDNLFSPTPSELVEMIPAIRDWLINDAFVGVNSFWRAAYWKNKLTGLPDVERKEENLRYLNACYVDIDCGRSDSNEPGGNDPWQLAWIKVQALAWAGIIPQPSIAVSSGRGGWLLWLICGPNGTDKMQEAWPDKLAFYKTCNRALGNRLRAQGLPVDKPAIDGARAMRVPGSNNTKAPASQRLVTWGMQGDDHGTFVYTLPELASMLGLPAPGAELPEEIRTLDQGPTYRKTKNPGSAPNKARGPQALNAMRAQDMLTLSVHRGGFLKRGLKYPDGSISYGREKLLWLYASFLRGTTIDQATALDAVRSLAATMKPPWPDAPDDKTTEALTEAAYSPSTKWKRWKSETLCGLLGITAEMARDIGTLRTIIPAEVQEEVRQALPLQEDVIRERKAWLKDYVTKHPNSPSGRPWSSRNVPKLLTPLRPPGEGWDNHTTANKDLNEIGYRTAGKHARRGK